MPPEEPAVPNAATVVETPPADQPPPKKELSFQERWLAATGKDINESDDSDAEETEAEAETPPAPVLTKDKKKKPEPVKAAEPKPADGPVTASERIAFSEAKRKHEEWYRGKQAEIAKLEQETTSKHGERISKAEAILKAIETGDPESFAQAVGTKDFNEFQESFIKRLADPNYKEVLELKKWREDREKREADEKKQAEEREASGKQAEAQRKHFESLKEVSSKSTDKLAAAMHDDHMFLNTIFAVQKAHYTATDQKVLSVEEALDKPIPGGQSTLRAELKKLYDRLAPVFAEPPALAAANGRKGPAPKTAVTPARTTDAAGGNGKWKNQKEWRAYASKVLAEADD